jgi:Tfp pilus assembly protein PilO
VTKRSLSTLKPKNVKLLAAFAGGLVAVAVLGYLVLISPQRSRAGKLDGEISAAQQQLVTAQIASQTKVEAPRVDDYFRLTKAMPDSTEMPGILLELSKVASETGIQFDSITPGSPVAAGSYQSVPIELSFRGTYYQLSDFLFRMRNLVEERDGTLDVGGRLYSIDGVNFSQGTGHSLEAKLSAKAYVYGQGAGSSTATPAPATATPPATTTGGSG